MRTWLPLNPGLTCIGIGWVFAFVAIAISPDTRIPEDTWTPYGLLVFAVAFMSFGVGWMYIDEGGEQ